MRRPAHTGTDGDKRIMSKETAMLHRLMDAGKMEEAHMLAGDLKKLRRPIQGLDLARARIFLARSETGAAYEALKEELRYFPDNPAAEALRRQLSEICCPRTADPELRGLLNAIAPYTMVGVKRLEALHANAKRICQGSAPGHFVECGVAAGGTSGLLAAVLKQWDASGERRLFSCDTFEGMPDPTDRDVHAGIRAQATGWGAGTCAGTEENLLGLCRALGAEDRVVPIKGLFGETLPELRAAAGPIALLHMDGDWYESTRDILVNLYDQLVPGAYVQVDDYGYWEGCKNAIHEFMRARGVKLTLNDIDGVGAWFSKPLTPGA